MNATAEINRASIIKLNSSNYQSWKFGAEMLLLKEDLWGVTNEEKPEQATEGWTRKDNSARATIALSIDPGLHKLIQDCRTSKEMWQRIKNYFERISFSSKLFLKRKLLSTKLEGNKMDDYLDKISCQVERLKNGGCNYDDGEMISIILCGLPESFDGLIMGLEAREENSISVEEVKQKLRDEAERREQSITNNAQQALSSFGNRQTRIYPERNKIICYECQGYGHVRRVCPNNIGTNRQTNYQPRTSDYGQQKPRNFSIPDNYNFNRSDRQEDKQINFCQDSESTRKPVAEDSEFFSLTSIETEEKAEKETGEEWIVDSGATNHMCHNNDTMVDYETFDHKRSIAFANGTRSQAEGIGSTKVKIREKETMILHDVLFVPEMKVNLISVSQLCAEGYEISFEKSKCKIQRGDWEITLGSISQGIFSTKRQTTEGERSYSACIHVWHERLGHRSIDDIKKLSQDNHAKNLTINKCEHSDFCPTCQTTNQTNKPFTRSGEISAKRIFEIIHADLCGPIQPTSRGGGNYMIILTDDFSRYAYLKIIKNKYEAGTVIKDYMNHFNNKFGHYPTYFRSDGGGEFQNRDLNNFFMDKGVRHQLSIPYSPQQNGVAERINRTIVSMTRAMLSGNNLPRSLWGEAASTSCYLYNRLIHASTRQIPLQLWEGRAVDYKHLRIMGSKTYSVIPKQTRTSKLSDTGREGILLGYSDLHKGYKILDTTNNEIIISRSVEFNEKPNPEKPQTEKTDEFLELEINENDGYREKEKEEDNTLRRSSRSNLGHKPTRFRE